MALNIGKSAHHGARIGGLADDPFPVQEYQRRAEFAEVCAPPQPLIDELRIRVERITEKLVSSCSIGEEAAARMKGTETQTPKESNCRPVLSGSIAELREALDVLETHINRVSDLALFISSIG